jgi:hypothetical protein
VSLPRVTPMPLARFDAPFEHPDWIDPSDFLGIEVDFYTPIFSGVRFHFLR